MKVGAWTLCPACRHMPKSDEDRARHLIATDHYQSAAVLAGISAHIAAGEPVNFQPDQVEAVVANLKRLDLKHQNRFRTRLITLGLLLFAAAAFLISYWISQRS